MLGYPGQFNWTSTGAKGMVVDVPAIPFTKLPTQWAWTFKLTNID